MSVHHTSMSCQYGTMLTQNTQNHAFAMSRNCRRERTDRQTGGRTGCNTYCDLLDKIRHDRCVIIPTYLFVLFFFFLLTCVRQNNDCMSHSVISYRMSACLSRSGTGSKRLNISSKFFHSMDHFPVNASNINSFLYKIVQYPSINMDFFIA